MSDAGQHHDGPPGLPEIIDEAGDTPTWVPLTGLALFALIALVSALRLQTPDEAAAPVEFDGTQADGADEPAQ